MRRLSEVHVESAVVNRHVRPTGQSIAVQQTVDVQRQQFHTLGKNQLTRRRGGSAILPVTCQYLSTAAY